MTIQEFIDLVEIDIGIFDGKPDSKTIYLGLDTGSDLTWTQCENCVKCFHQVNPYYPASQSHSYKPIPCSQCASTAECSENVCKETRMYGDGSVVKAIIATESFVFRSQNDGLEIDGQDMNNKFNGYLGMGYGQYSFPEQAKILVNGKFSYCLQPEEEGLPPMHLRFGDDVIQPPAEVYTTPMFKRADREGHHYLNLCGIRVDDEDLDLPPGVFYIKSDGTGGCIIDTGTPTSRITSAAYTIFKDAVARNIESANKNVERFQSTTSGLDLCYKRVSEPETVNLPYITWVFAGAADFFMTSDLTFDTFQEDGFPIVCLLFLESNQAVGGLTILGSEQQIDHRIIYDLTNGQLHFGPEDCSNGA
ncbi:aspartic proteinase nepenthesin-2-like [Chenopodium quinoa]|uniref:aspartic proteinase nepenthesin-2-like n=1 Tax=Chenopodium quinoa TaxID=63459 RepID=UPI000B794899|nr:aspartic proteinase nepenthesin-2-like [Chenopodium quinoa]